MGYIEWHSSGDATEINNADRSASVKCSSNLAPSPKRLLKKTIPEVPSTQ